MVGVKETLLDAVELHSTGLPQAGLWERSATPPYQEVGR